MAEVEPPALPGFLRNELPFGRSGYRLERGADRGRLVHLLDHGHRLAQPVLLQHGNPSWSFLWRKVIAGLPPRRYRSVAVDLLGFGLSDKLPRVGEHSLARHLDVLIEVVETLDLNDLILVGQDWGGPLIACLGAAHPRRIAGVVLANTSVLVPPRPKGTWFHRLARMPVVSDILFRWLGFPQNVMSRVQGDRTSISKLASRAYRFPFSSISERAGPLGLARMVPDSNEHPSIPLLKEGESWMRGFSGPVALVWGKRDPILGRALVHHRRAFPAASVTETDAGHFIQEEAPEALIAGIDAVAARTPPAS